MRPLIDPPGEMYDNCRTAPVFLAGPSGGRGPHRADEDGHTDVSTPGPDNHTRFIIYLVVPLATKLASCERVPCSRLPGTRAFVRSPRPAGRRTRNLS